MRRQCQAFPNFCGSNAKLFQRKLWGFCGISKGYRGPNRKMMFPQIFVLQEWTQIARGTRSIRPDLTERRKTTVTQLAFLKKINRQKIGHKSTKRKRMTCRPAPTISTEAAARLDHS